MNTACLVPEPMGLTYHTVLALHRSCSPVSMVLEEIGSEDARSS